METFDINASRAQLGIPKLTKDERKKPADG